jgi:hypothetical protein
MVRCFPSMIVTAAMAFMVEPAWELGKTGLWWCCRPLWMSMWCPNQVHLPMWEQLRLEWMYPSPPMIHSHLAILLYNAYSSWNLPRIFGNLALWILTGAHRYFWQRFLYIDHFLENLYQNPMDFAGFPVAYLQNSFSNQYQEYRCSHGKPSRK